MPVAFFDLDRTVLDVNSGHLWLREEWRRGRYGVRTVAAAVYWLGRYALGDDDLDHAFQGVGRIYANLDDATLAAQVDAWFDREVRQRARPGALDALRRHREAGDAVVLATSSSHYAADCAQRAWGFDDTVATRMAVVDGRLTGEIAALAFGRRKLDLCAAWAEARGHTLDDATFYTDSFSDLPLLERVGNPVVVAPDRRLARVARERGWPVARW
jgi:HAD superfamily hydrolase (TIGR01490 family)